MYKILASLGHNISPQYPSLVPIYLKEDVSALRGISFKCIGCTLICEDTKKHAEGEILFTDKGISGPVVLTLSAYAAGKTNLKVYLDFFPYRSKEEIDKKLINIFSTCSNSALKTALSNLLPKSLALYMLSYAAINGDKKCAEVAKSERNKIVDMIKGLEFLVNGMGGFEQAVITRGGVELTQIDPKTMESKLYKNLYIVGELLNIDALTGGYNLQLAWSTALAAANDINQKLNDLNSPSKC